MLNLKLVVLLQWASWYPIEFLCSLVLSTHTLFCQVKIIIISNCQLFISNIQRNYWGFVHFCTQYTVFNSLPLALLFPNLYHNVFGWLLKLKHGFSRELIYWHVINTWALMTFFVLFSKHFIVVYENFQLRIWLKLDETLFWSRIYGLKNIWKKLNCSYPKLRLSK